MCMQLLVLFLTRRLYFAVYLLNNTSATVSQVCLCFFTVRVSVSQLMRYRFLGRFLYFSEILFARVIPGVSSFFSLETKQLHKKYLCTELVYLPVSPIRILFGHIIACVQNMQELFHIVL